MRPKLPVKRRDGVETGTVLEGGIRMGKKVHSSQSSAVSAISDHAIRRVRASRLPDGELIDTPRS